MGSGNLGGRWVARSRSPVHAPCGSCPLIAGRGGGLGREAGRRAALLCAAVLSKRVLQGLLLKATPALSCTVMRPLLFTAQCVSLLAAGAGRGPGTGGCIQLCWYAWAWVFRSHRGRLHHAIHPSARACSGRAGAAGRATTAWPPVVRCGHRYGGTDRKARQKPNHTRSRPRPRPPCACTSTRLLAPVICTGI